MTSREVWCQYINTGRPVELRNRIVEQNIELVHKCVGTYMKTLPRHTTLQKGDLLSHGYEALMRAVEKYNPDAGSAFNTFAYRWVAPRIRGTYREDCDQLSRHARREKGHDGSYEFVSLTQLIGGMKDWDGNVGAFCGSHARMMPDSRLGNDDYGHALGYAKEPPVDQQAYDHEYITTYIDGLKCLRGFSNRDRNILRMHVFEGKTLRECGRRARPSISESRASQLMKHMISVLCNDKELASNIKGNRRDSARMN